MRSTGREWARAVCWVLLLPLFLGRTADAAESAGIEFGVLPVLSTRTVFDVYRPLREYLQQRLHKPVTLVTAPDYRTYVERTQRGDYRFLVTAPHFARLAQSEAGYVPMVRVRRELYGVIVVREDSSFRSLSDLRGNMITSPEPIAIISILGQRLLRENGLVPGRDVTVLPLPSFNSAVLALRKGEAGGAITAPTALAQMKEPKHPALRVLARTPAVPPLIYLASGTEPAPEVESMIRALLDFSSDTSHGREFFQRTNFVSFVRLTPAELSSLDPYVAELKRLLADR